MDEGVRESVGEMDGEKRNGGARGEQPSKQAGGDEPKMKANVHVCVAVKPEMLKACFTNAVLRAHIPDLK